MNIVNTLTLRHIQTHKKRSILTILAIIVSVAMVSAVFTSAQSFIQYFQNVSKAIDGNWHSIVLTEDYQSNAAAFAGDDIAQSGICATFGAAQYDGQPEDEFGLDIHAVDESFLELRNVKISEGRMPKNTSEILLHRKFVEKQKLGWKIGDTIKLPVVLHNDIAPQTMTFTVVGFTDSEVDETSLAGGFVCASEDFIRENAVKVYLQFSKLDRTVYEKTEALAKAANPGNEDPEVGYNTFLLTYSGVSTEDETIVIMLAFCSVILLIIAVVSILMIYDSFAVSYQERARYLGMLASVGATKRQKRASIYFEGFILGLIGIPLGLLTGIGGMWATFKAISSVWVETLAVEYDGVLTVKVNWLVILGTVLSSALTIFVSSYIPSRKASRTTAIEAIRQTNTVKVKSSKRLRTSKLAAKLLGYEGALAVKNFKRNSKRSGTIVFALAMSVVVALSVANFSLMFKDVMGQSYSYNPDLTASVPYQDAAKLDSAVGMTDGINSSFSTNIQYVYFDTSLVRDDAREKFTKEQVMLIFVDNVTLDTYLKQLGERAERYHDTSNPTGILHNCAISRDGEQKIKVYPLQELTGQKLTTQLKVFSPNGGENEIVTIDPVVGIQTKEDYKNEAFYYQDMHLPTMVMSIDMAEQFFAKSENLNTYYTASIFCNDADEVESDLRNNAFRTVGIRDVHINNATAQMNAINNILTIVKVFVFGFITLITLISIMNIVNTISNSMNERRREFAMIRSVGMTPKSFKKMIYYESFRYGLVSLLWSIPISIGIHYGMYYILSSSYDYGFVLYPLVYLAAIAAVFAIISVAILYSVGKIRNDNIIETLKRDIN